MLSFASPGIKGEQSSSSSADNSSNFHSDSSDARKAD